MALIDFIGVSGAQRVVDPYTPGVSEIGYVPDPKKKDQLSGPASWAQYMIDVARLPFTPWIAPRVWGQTYETAKDTLETGKLPEKLTYDPALTPMIPGWPEFPGWPDIDLEGLGEAATKFGAMALIGLALVLGIMVFK